MQRFFRDIAAGVQTLRFLTALVMSAAVTTAVAGPMAYQALSYDPQAAVLGQASSATRPNGPPDGGVAQRSTASSTPSSAAATTGASTTAAPTTAAPTTVTTAPSTTAAPAATATTAAPPVSTTLAIYEPDEPELVQADVTIPTLPEAPAATTPTTSAPTVTSPMTPTTIITVPTAPPITSPWWYAKTDCGEGTAHELDADEGGNCNEQG